MTISTYPPLVYIYIGKQTDSDVHSMITPVTSPLSTSKAHAYIYRCLLIFLPHQPKEGRTRHQQYSFQTKLRMHFLFSLLGLLRALVQLSMYPMLFSMYEALCILNIEATSVLFKPYLLIYRIQLNQGFVIVSIH